MPRMIVDIDTPTVITYRTGAIELILKPGLAA
jgi:hypothetical protein